MFTSDDEPLRRIKPEPYPLVATFPSTSWSFRSFRYLIVIARRSNPPTTSCEIATLQISPPLTAPEHAASVGMTHDAPRPPAIPRDVGPPDMRYSKITIPNGLVRMNRFCTVCHGDHKVISVSLLSVPSGSLWSMPSCHPSRWVPVFGYFACSGGFDKPGTGFSASGKLSADHLDRRKQVHTWRHVDRPNNKRYRTCFYRNQK